MNNQEENLGLKTCALCDQKADTRPYGKQGEELCYPCGMKDELQSARGYARANGYTEAQAPDELLEKIIENRHRRIEFMRSQGFDVTDQERW